MPSSRRDPLAMRFMQLRSPALYVSVAALVAALGGTALAGGYIVTSTRQIKPSVRKALKGKRGPRGYSGAAGANGAAGPAGPVGPAGVLGLTAVDSPTVTIPPGSTSYEVDPNSLTAQCPPGSTVVGTGIDTGIGDLDLLRKYGTFVGGFVDNDTSITIQASVQAICAQLPPGAAQTRSGSNRASFEADVRALAARSG
jgi:hypothetical protein